MEDRVTPQALLALALNCATFALCFAVWMLNGVLVTFLVEQRVFDWNPVQMGWLMAMPVLSGSILRLPAGMLTDRYGGKPILISILLFTAISVFALGFATGFWSFLVLSLAFGVAGTSFSVGIAYTSVWYPQRWQGTALGIFGAGNAGAALTTLIAPSLLVWLTSGGERIENWIWLPRIFMAALVFNALILLIFARNKVADKGSLPLKIQLAPLTSLRVWRFGLYYFLVFGMFVAFSQWLIPYFVNVYGTTLVVAGILAACFSFPSGVIRALGGWISDRWGARRVMYWVLWSSVACSLVLVMPPMEIVTPGQGITARRSGVVESISNAAIVVNGDQYKLEQKTGRIEQLRREGHMLIWPAKEEWQKPIVQDGAQVERRQLLARGETHIYFQANVWIAVTLIIIIGTMWGIGKAAIYKYIPEYFPGQVGVVGGMVGMIGGLGGFVGPVTFGYMLSGTGLWTSCWIMMFVLSVVCLVWLHRTVILLTRRAAPQIAQNIEPKDDQSN